MYNIKMATARRHLSSTIHHGTAQYQNRRLLLPIFLLQQIIANTEDSMSAEDKHKIWVMPLFMQGRVWMSGVRDVTDAVSRQMLLKLSSFSLTGANLILRLWVTGTRLARQQ